MIKIFKLFGEIAIDGLTKAEKDITNFEKKVKKAIRPVERFGRTASAIGVSFTKAFTVPLGLAGGAVTKFGADFEQSMTNSLSIMGDLSSEMRQTMADTARVVGKDVEGGARAAADAYFFLASAGKDAEQSMALLPKVAKFATAGNFDLARATDLLTDAQSALGLSSKNAAEDMENLVRVSDVLVGANTLANASVEQFSESLTNKAGAALRLLGKDVEEGVAVLAAFADQGLKGEAAGEALNIVMRDLQRAAIKNKRAFEAANIAVFDANGEMRNMADIIADLEKRLSGMSDEQKRAELTLLGFQDKSISATMALLDTSEAIRGYEKDLRGMAGTTEEVAKKQLASLSAMWRRIKNELVDVAIELSETLVPLIKDQVIPVLTAMIRKLAEAARWFTSLPDGVQQTIIAFTAFLAVIGPILIGLGSLISSIKVVTSAIAAAKLAVIAFNAVLAASPVGLAVIALGTLAGAVALTASKYKELQKQHQKFTVMTSDEAAQKAFISNFDAMMKKLESFSGAINTTDDFVKEFRGDVEELTEQARALGFNLEGSVEERFKALSQISGELRGAVDLATGSMVKYNESSKETNDKTEEGTGLTLEQIEALKELEKQRREMSADYNAQLEELTMSEWELLNLEEARAVERAEAVRASEEEIATIREVFALRRNELLMDQAEEELRILEGMASEEDRMEKEKTRKEDQARKDKERKEAQSRQTMVALAQQAANQLFQIFSMSTQNRIAQIDQELAREQLAVEQSTLNETQKQEKLSQLEQEADERRKELMKKQAKRDKAAAIFATVVNTAQAVAKALTLGPPVGFVMAAIMGALGIAQIGLIAAQPLPEFADGALVRKRPGGMQAIIGEGNEDEAVLPMRRGAYEIADRIMQRIGDASAMVANSAASAFSSPIAPVASAPAMRPVNYHWHIGTLIADDRGLKELERRQNTIRVHEDQRKGKA